MQANNPTVHVQQSVINGQRSSNNSTVVLHRNVSEEHAQGYSNELFSETARTMERSSPSIKTAELGKTTQRGQPKF